MTVTFGGLTALDAVSLHVRPGSVHGVIGPNGAGKTTLLNVVCGFVRPRAGTLRWQGRRLDRVRPHRLAGLGITRTVQGVGLFAGLTVLENVMVGADRHRRAGLLASAIGLPRSDRDERSLAERARAALAAVDAVRYADRLPPTLPYPVQKRVALARALVAEPRLLLLDEPAGGLSGAEISELADHVRALRPLTSVMLVEHHMDFVLAVCDTLTVLDFGSVVASGSPAEVTRDPAVVDAYLGRPVPPGAHP
jgi:branched-chain amino acid transport system ATP-binding protein